MVVIAIIGILAAVILTAVNSAKTKAKDAAIKSGVVQAGKQAELYFDGDYTGKSLNCVTGTGAGTCAYLVNNLDTELQPIGKIAENTTGLTISSDATSYTISAPLSTPGSNFSVKSDGTVGNITSAEVRDARRKSDINQIQMALEKYYNDHGSYITITVPPSSSWWRNSTPGTSDQWAFTGSINGDLSAYLPVLPKDPKPFSGTPTLPPTNVGTYWYFSSGPSFYMIVYSLENKSDKLQLIDGVIPPGVAGGAKSCPVLNNSVCTFHYGSVNNNDGIITVGKLKGTATSATNCNPSCS